VVGVKTTLGAGIIVSALNQMGDLERNGYSVIHRIKEITGEETVSIRWRMAPLKAKNNYLLLEE